MNKPLRSKDLIKHLQCVDPDSFVMYDTGYGLQYVYVVDEDQGVKLSTDEVELLSHYDSLEHMEKECLDSPYETLDFFSITVLQ